MSTEVRARQAQDLGAPRHGILILGMHRSGTSALARVVNLLGAASPADLMSARPSNPRGHWESNCIFAIHEELLKAAGTAWDDWRQVDPSWFESSLADTYRQQLKRAVITEYGENNFIYIKDPRICRFVPFWLDILNELNITPSVILSVRNPLEVAYSLERQNGFSLEKSLLLWLRHTLDAEYATRRLPRSFVEVEKLISDWQGSMLSVGKKLGISWPDLSNVAKVQIEELVGVKLRHHNFIAQDLYSNRDLIGWVVDIYESIQQYLSDSDDLNLQSSFNIVRERFEEGCSAFGAVLRSEERKVLELSSQLVKAQAKNDQFATGHVEKLKTLEAANSLANDELQLARAESEKFKVLNEYLNVDIERLKQALSRYEAVLERIQIESSETDDKNIELIELRRELEEQNAALIASTSWRVTRPIRWIGTGWKSLRNSRQRGF